MLSFRRLAPSIPSDLLAFKAAFRGAPSYVYASGGNVPTDEQIEEMMNTMPSGYTADDMFIYEVSENTRPCGCAFVARGYPRPETAYLVLLLIVEAVQGRSVGRVALRYLESLARSWGCSSVAAVVDSANERALKFWLREGYVETRRTQLPGLVGQAIAIEKSAL
jgi:GNAT superfamily N-acetyltransferase